MRSVPGWVCWLCLAAPAVPYVGWAERAPPMVPAPRIALPIPPNYKSGDLTNPVLPAGTKEPVPIVKAKPEYPLAAIILGIKGVVIVDCVVNRAGTVQHAFALRSPSPILSEPAVAAVKRCLFEPGRERGVKTDMRMQVPVKFSFSRKERAELLKKLPKDAGPTPAHQTVPDYPREALMLDLKGEVLVEFVVTTEGTVKDVHAIKSTYPILEAPAISAVSRWLFVPRRKQGRNVETRLQIPIVFNPTAELREAMKLKDEVNIALPFANQDQRPPLLKLDLKPVYPFPALLENRRATLVGTVKFDDAGRAEAPVWEADTPPEFAAAVEAMLDACGSAPDSPAPAGRRRLQLTFDPSSGNVRISDAAAAILKRLRTEGDDAVFAGENDLDAKLAPIRQPAPVFPRRLCEQTERGEAVVGFFVDATGQVQLPHVISTSDPAFGYAACQAIATWRFTPPMRDGIPTTVRARIPVEFKLK